MYDKEAIYDEKIFPLMAEIINICKENQIHMLASFYLREENEDGEGMHCTTHLTSSEGKSEALIDCHKRIFRKPFVMAMTITSTEGKSCDG